jgi:hypothetical protein
MGGIAEKARECFLFDRKAGTVDTNQAAGLSLEDTMPGLVEFSQEGKEGSAEEGCC